MSLMPLFYDFERPFRMMEREFFRGNDFESPFNRMMPRGFYNPPGFFNRPWDNMFLPIDDFMKPMDRLTSAMNQLAVRDVSTNIISDNEKFQVNVDVQHFSPEEISVRVVNREVMIEGKHEEKRDPHGYVSRQFVRKYTLPEGCLPDTVQSNLSSDGVLTVTAPKVLALPSRGEKIIPITHTGPVKKVGYKSSTDAE